MHYFYPVTFKPIAATRCSIIEFPDFPELMTRVPSTVYEDESDKFARVILAAELERRVEAYEQIPLPHRTATLSGLAWPHVSIFDDEDARIRVLNAHNAQEPKLRKKNRDKWNNFIDGGTTRDSRYNASMAEWYERLACFSNHVGYSMAQLMVSAKLLDVNFK